MNLFYLRQYWSHDSHLIALILLSIIPFIINGNKLTCPLDSKQQIEATRCQKQQKHEYLQLLAELNCLNISNHTTSTVEVSVLGRYQHKAIKDIVCFIRQDLPVPFPKASARAL